MSESPSLGIIGGSGMYGLGLLRGVEELHVETPFGVPSDVVRVGEIDGSRVAFISRHGQGHRLSPSEVPYAANVCALKMLGVTSLVSISAVGSLREECAPRSFVVPDQTIDRTRQRRASFFGDGVVAHVSLARPFCRELSAAVKAAAGTGGLPVSAGGTYVCIEGPQFSTEAESALFRSWGAAIIGMTALPEARLAREAELCYACLAMVTDYDVWHEQEGPVSVEGVIANLQAMTSAVQTIVGSLARMPPHACASGCRDALNSAIITSRDAISPETLERLAPIAGRYLGVEPVPLMLARVRFTELQLLVIPTLMTVVGLLTIYLASTRDLDWDWRDIWVSLAFMVAVFAISVWFSAIGFRGDQVLFPVVVSLTGLGLLLVQRLAPDLTAQDPDFATLARNQLLYLWLGLAMLAVVCTVVRQIGWLRRYKYTWAFGALFLMLLTMAFGTEQYGARLWIDVGPFTIQTSEIAKVAMVVFLAGYLAEKRDLIVSTYRIGPLRLPPLPYLAPMVLMWAFSLLIVVLQNDLGTALLFFGVFLAMLYMASGKLLYVVGGLATFAVGVYVAYQTVGRVQLRVQNWLNPWSDPLDVGYQQIQSEYAMASGELFGSGLAMGHPTYIPAVQTDYVFAAIGEELGLLGTVVVLLLFLLLVYRGFYIALTARDAFGRFLAAGLTTILALQALIIIGGTVRLIPLTGITLPFVSAGGSSLLTNFLIIGLLLRISDPTVTR